MFFFRPLRADIYRNNQSQSSSYCPLCFLQVRNDHLDLQVPEYVKDIGFLKSSGSLPKIVTGTAYHKLRLYDLTAQKRPVLDISYKESPISCVSIPSHEMYVVLFFRKFLQMHFPVITSPLTCFFTRRSQKNDKSSNSQFCRR